MLTNRINQFGVRQRCMESGRSLSELLLTALHYERDVNFYICKENLQFLGTINRKVLLEAGYADMTSARCDEITVGEICKNHPSSKRTDAFVNPSPGGGHLASRNGYRKPSRRNFRFLTN